MLIRMTGVGAVSGGKERSARASAAGSRLIEFFLALAAGLIAPGQAAAQPAQAEDVQRWQVYGTTS